MQKKILIFVVSYNAEHTLARVLSRIPETLFHNPQFRTEILVIDDCSSDDTFTAGEQFRAAFTLCPLVVLRNPKNLGYGGNQKVGYQYAIENGFDHVVLLHGDGQYAPEELPRLLEPLLENRAEAVFGSRMLQPSGALRGGMPLYKFLGNKFLTFLQNLIVGTRLSEYHSGYRLYSVRALKSVPFQRNPDYFDFDTDIIIQFHHAGHRIVELPIPTFYGDEICYVNGIKYAAKIVLSCLLFRIQQLGILYDPKFDIVQDNSFYTEKFDFLSSHSLAVEPVRNEESLLLIGSGPLPLVQPFLKKARAVSVIDQFVAPELRESVEWSCEGDIDTLELKKLFPPSTKFERVFALDIIEHLRSPERFLEQLRQSPATRSATLMITTPNIAFLPIRIMLALGSFNYGKKGILDRTHTRLFTRKSLRKLLEQHGFEISQLRGIPAPFPLALGRNIVSRTLLQLNDTLCSYLPGLFSYQILCESRALPTLGELLDRTIEHTAQNREEMKSRVSA